MPISELRARWGDSLREWREADGRHKAEYKFSCVILDFPNPEFKWLRNSKGELEYVRTASTPPGVKVSQTVGCTYGFVIGADGRVADMSAWGRGCE